VIALIGLALAGPPGPILASAEGTPTPPELVCDPLVEGIVLCYRVEAEGVRRYVTEADLPAWQTSRAGLRRAAKEGLTENPLERVAVAGGGTYWQAQAAGREGALLLHPEWLATVADDLLVGVPARGVVVLWEPGDADTDKILAVGVRQMYDELDHPVSPVVMRWRGGEWSVWGQAKPPATEQ